MKQLYVLGSVLLLSCAVFAQQEIPLRGNPVLHLIQSEKEKKLPFPIPQAVPREKSASCITPEPGVTYAEAGRPVRIDIEIDTLGLGREGTYNCLNCAAAPGQAVLEGTQLRFTPDPGVVAERYAFEVEYCNRGQCRADTLQVVAKRAGKNHFPPRITLRAGERIVAGADAEQLPGAVDCNVFTSCPDQYEGRNQLVYFKAFRDPQFFYQSARYAGIDSVCVVLCDEFTICDTFHFAFQIRQDTLRLPFMDDFSYAGPFPDGVHWLDEDTYVNNELGENPPSFGVATFDGLNYRGDVYGGGYGPSDRLTSNYISMKSATGDVYLSYWIQRRGLGDRPEIKDSLVLEFKDRDGRWQYIRGFPGSSASLPNTAPEPFRYYRDKLDPTYLHQAFQFRFTNYSDRNGILDNWHVDYVRLSDVVTQNDSIFNDVAFTQYPKDILKRYSSMPWSHFTGNEAEELDSTITVHLFNHSDQTLNVGSQIAVVEKEVTIPAFTSTLLNDEPGNLNSNIPAGVPVSKEFSLLAFPFPASAVWPRYINNLKSSIYNEISPLHFAVQYRMQPSSEVNASGLDAVQRNNQVEKVTVFDNYFAYDDGTAESGFIAQEGQNVAVRFRANVDDTLRAIRIHFPFTTINASDQLFDLKVWVGDLEGEPDYIAFLQTPYYASSFFDTLQGFTTYPLVDAAGNFAPLALPRGDFYIGWEQITPCTGTDCIAVGYDRNTPQAKDNIFVLQADGWKKLGDLVFTVRGGALMMRPIVGSETPGFTPVEEIPAPPQARVYPNPTSQQLNIDLPDAGYERYQYWIFNGVGQRLQYGPLQPQIDLGNLPAGIYYLRIFQPDRNQVQNFKVLKLD